MRYIRFILFSFLFLLAAFATANACESKGEVTTSASFPLKKNECHQFVINKGAADYFLISARQNGVDVELRLFEGGREIKATDSENLNSGFEFLPFKANTTGNYLLQVKWVDDRQTMLKNEGGYVLEVEGKTATEQDSAFIEQFERAKYFYDKATSERLGNNSLNAVNDYLSAAGIYQALPQDRAVKYKSFLTNYYLGVSYNLLKKYSDAVTTFERIKTSASEIQDKHLEGLFLKELGIAYYKTGGFQKGSEAQAIAARIFEQLKLEKIGEKQTLPSVYLNQAETSLKLNNIENAIALLENVRTNFSETVSENLLASLKLADIYFDLGDSRKAEEIMASLTISDSLPNYVKGVFNKVSGKLYMKNQKEKALNFFGKANILLAENDSELAELQMFTGNAHYYAKDYLAAKPFYEQAKTLFERENDLSDLAQVLNNLGVIHFARKDYALAIATCEDALSINTTLQSDLNQARNLINLMYFYESNGDETSAVLYGKWAINTIQSVKYIQLQNLDKEIQDNFRESFNDAFRKLADLLIKDGRISEAEQVLRFIKEKEYNDYMRGEAKLNAVEYTRSEERLLQGVKNKLGKKSSPQDNAEILPRGELSPTQILIEELKAQKVNMSEILFVSTLATANSVSIIATNDRTQKVYTQKIPRETLNKLVFEFRNSLTDLERNPQIEGKKLYDILVKPLENDVLSPNIKKIVWSLDGVLRYISVPALFDGKNYLVQRFANVQLTLASEEKILMPKTFKSPAIGFASSKPFENLSSLPIAKNELDCIFEDEKRLIINSTCKKGIIRGKKVADEEFTQEVFEDALKKYKLIHLTSHFVLNTGDNSKSFLLLGGGQNRKYTMQSFSKQNLDNAEILIMSACNTANFSTDGAEFESFATMAQKQGAKAVIGTLWSVADISTSKFMTEFYRLFEVEKYDKAESLRLAQVNISKNKNYAHPFYWSPFVLYGNWK